MSKSVSELSEICSIISWRKASMSFIRQLQSAHWLVITLSLLQMLGNSIPNVFRIILM